MRALLRKFSLRQVAPPSEDGAVRNGLSFYQTALVIVIPALHSLATAAAVGGSTDAWFTFMDIAQRERICKVWVSMPCATYATEDDARDHDFCISNRLIWEFDVSVLSRTDS